MADSADGAPLKLSTFLHRGSTLKQMDAHYTLKREFAYLQALCDLGARINLLSFGGREELDYAPTSQDIRVLCNSWGLPERRYARRVHQIHAPHLLRSDLICTREVHGMRAAMRAGWAWRLPVVCRMDYFWSTSIETDPQVSPAQLREAVAYERKVFLRATQTIVAAQSQAEEVLCRAPEAAGKVAVVPQHVDCEIFKPSESAKRYDLVYVGRLSAIKNLESILEAVERSGATIAVIGGGTMGADGLPREGEIEAGLKARFGDLDGRIRWLGGLPHEDLPGYINQAKALILCSFSEGLPRVMLEAFACGLPVIGSKVGGIASTVRQGETGWLCGTDADSITAAIEAALSQPELLVTMGINARKFALDNFSLPAIARQEYELLADVARRNPVASAPRRIANYVMRRR